VSIYYNVDQISEFEKPLNSDFIPRIIAAAIPRGENESITSTGDLSIFYAIYD
jgi:hypothetical protein